MQRMNAETAAGVADWIKEAEADYPVEFSNNPHQRRPGVSHSEMTSPTASQKRKARRKIERASRRRNRNRK